MIFPTTTTTTHTGGGELARLAPVEASKYEDQY